MEPDKIFSLFNNEPSNENNSPYVSFEEHPLYLIKMFIKIHQRKKEFSKVVSQNVSSKQENLTEYVINIRAFYYLEKIDIKSKVSQDILRTQSSKEVIDVINYSMMFFEELEHYEKCSLLKKVKEIIS